MRTTSDQRRQAVQIATRLLDPNEPHLLDIGETTLLAHVIIDCRDQFVLYAPVVEAARRCVREDGSFVMGGPCWTELIASVAELRRAG